MRYFAAVAVGLAIGLAGGFVWGRYSVNISSQGTGPAIGVEAPKGQALVEQSEYLTNIGELEEYEFFYPRAFASPPALTIREENAPPFTGWQYRITEQRADGFKVRFSGTAGIEANKLRYSARGLPAQ